MSKRRRRKRKSRTELYRARATKAYTFISRIHEIVPGGNPFGLGEWTLSSARGHARP